MVFFSFLSWFRPWWKTSETDYETILGRLSKDINTVQTRLVRINHRERRASVTLTFYAVLLWLIYAIGLWYWSADKRSEMSRAERAKLWSTVLLGLIFIISTRFLVRWWYRRIADGEEKHLRSLQRTRRKKIDEIKQATRYDHLRSLLEKYDDTAGMALSSNELNGVKGKSKTSARAPRASMPASMGPNSSQRTRAPLITESGPTLAVNDVAVREEKGKGIAVRPGMKSSPSLSNGTPVEPGLPTLKQSQFQRTWLDRVADKILGAEVGGQATAAEQRYALICRICYTHNGLCPKEEWEEVQYICPRCGTFNSRRPSTAPVSTPWTKSTSQEGHSPATSSIMLPSPTPSKLTLPRGGSDESGNKEEDAIDESREELIKDEQKQDTIRSRKSTLGKIHDAQSDMEEMEVD